MFSLLLGHHGAHKPHASYRKTLSARGSSYVFLDDAMPVRGHGAGNTRQFNAWYGLCVVDFLDDQDAPAPGETVCPGPSPVPAYLLPYGYRPPADGGPGSFLGAWGGAYSIGKKGARNICILVEREFPGGFMARTAFGAGSQRKADMVTYRRLFDARSGGRTFVYKRGKYSMTISADPDRRDVSLLIRSKEGNEYRTRLKRGCRLEDDRPLTG